MCMVYRYQCFGGACCLIHFKVKPLCIVPEGTVEKMLNVEK